ncbi:MAG: hypothetical protein KAJ12_05320 [Bacteroidetes bacterium]|nr:hypothetical protein [Bacteroidota bacterium]
MKELIPLLVITLCLIGCGAPEQGEPAPGAGQQAPALKVEYTVPEPAAVPAYVEPTSETDWKAKVNNKNKEIVEVLNIINPIAAYITAGFEQYGGRIENPTVHEEWSDTQVQLTMALELYESCKEKIKAENYSKQLFLDMEETWQILVKTGVAGVRTKSMLDAELTKL